MSFIVTGQTIIVKDKDDNSPINNVAIFNLDGTKSVLTNKAGMANAILFDESDTLIFQHTSFYEVILPYAIVKQLANSVKLSKKSVRLAEIVVSANKWEQNKSEIPNKIESILAKDIELSNPQTAADLIGLSGEVFIQKSQLGGGSPMIRGFSANSILLIVDGVRLNNAIFRSGNLQNIIMLDANIMESAEVIFGPGSIIYGSDALGGVLDFHTKNIVFNKDRSDFSETNLFTRYSSANSEKTIHFDFTKSRKKWGFMGSFTYSDFGDLRMGSSEGNTFDRMHYVETINGQDNMILNSNPDIQRQSAYKQLNVINKIRFQPTEKLDLHYTFNLSTSSNIPRYDRLASYSGENLKYAEWYYGPQKWQLQALSGHLKDSRKYYDEVKFTAAYQHLNESRFNRKFNSQSLNKREEILDIYSLSIDLEKNLTKKASLFYGVEAVHNNVQSKAYAENIFSGDQSDISTRYPDGGSKYSSYAAYLSYKYNMNSHFTFLSGIRYNYIKLNSRFISQQFFDFPFDQIIIDNGAMNASMGLVYRPVKETQLNLNLSSGFRAPNIDDVAKVFDSAPGNVIVPNENLRPEKAYNIDLGLNHTTADIDFSIVGFYTYLDNAMVRRPYTFNGANMILYDGELSVVESIVNAGYANIWGASLSLSVKLNSDFEIYMNHNFTKGKDNDKLPLRHVAPLYGRLGLKYETEQLTMDLYANYNGEISYANLAESEKNKAELYAKNSLNQPYSPGWVSLNFKAIYNLNKTTQIRLGLDNVFDLRYRPYSSGISAPGRNLYLGFRLTI